MVEEGGEVEKKSEAVRVKKREEGRLRGEENRPALTADFQTGCRLNTNSYKTQ